MLSKISNIALLSKFFVNSLPFSSNLPSCNEVTKELLGHFEPDATYLTDEQLSSQDYAKNIDINGCYTPDDCIPEEKLLVVVPYRDRQQHLNILLNNLHPMLQRQKLSYCIMVSEQHDTGKFNKGLLMNAAFAEAEQSLGFDCIVLHDVDMLPENDQNLYKCGERGPVHLSPKISKYNYNYPYGTDFGGVTMMSRAHYNLVNGHTNMFWGWGKEDSDMEYRISAADLRIELPEPIDLGRYTMLKHQHISTWQNEAVTIGIEDDRSTSLKRTLMGMKEQRSQYDGLNSLKYKVIKNEETKLYNHLIVEVRRAETIKHEITIGDGQYTQTIDPNQEATCKYFEFPNSYVGPKYTFKDFKPSETINVTACGAGCSGFSKYDNSLPTNNNSGKTAKNFAFSYPILQTNPNSTVYLKHCENDPTGWQIIPKGIQIDEENNINVLLKFTVNKLVEDLGQLYYRDSWVYEGQRYKTNNLAINTAESVTSFDGTESDSILETLIAQKRNETDTISNNNNNNQTQAEIQSKPSKIIFTSNSSDNTTQITVNLNTKVARGNYMVFSKIVDSFGQPIAELNWFSKLTGGTLDMNSFKEEHTKSAEIIRERFEVQEKEDANNITNNSRGKIDLITFFKSEMKKDFKMINKVKNYEQHLNDRL